MNIRECVEWLATVCTVALWLTGVPTCRKIMRQGNTANVSFFPFMVMFCSSTMWFKYGMVKEDPFLVKINLIGSILNFLFASVYYFHTNQRTLIHRQLVLGAVLVYPVLLYLRFYASTRTDAILVMGIACASLSVLAYGAPLAALAEVWRTRSTEAMSLPLSVSNFFVAIEWFYYGVIMGDLYIKVPNGLGICLGVVQLSLIFTFRSTAGKKQRTLTKHSDVPIL